MSTNAIPTIEIAGIEQAKDLLQRHPGIYRVVSIWSPNIGEHSLDSAAQPYCWPDSLFRMVVAEGQKFWHGQPKLRRQCRHCR